MRVPVPTMAGKLRFLALVVSAVALFVAPISASSADDVRILCLNEPWMVALDGDEDGTITLDELEHAASVLPDNTFLEDLLERFDSDDLTGIQYEGSCHAVGEDGESVQGEDGGNVDGQDGESVEGEDGESAQGQDGEQGQAADGEASDGEDGVAVQGEDGESVQGQDGGNVDGQDGEAVDGQDGKAVDGRDGEDGESATVLDERGEGSVMCAPAPELQLIDGDDDGLITMDEISSLIEMVGGNADLERTRDQAVEQGIGAIRYRDCVLELPEATPAASTPVAVSSTP